MPVVPSVVDAGSPIEEKVHHPDLPTRRGYAQGRHSVGSPGLEIAAGLEERACEGDGTALSGQVQGGPVVGGDSGHGGPGIEELQGGGFFPVLQGDVERRDAGSPGRSDRCGLDGGAPGDKGLDPAGIASLGGGVKHRPAIRGGGPGQGPGGEQWGRDREAFLACGEVERAQSMRAGSVGIGAQGEQGDQRLDAPQLGRELKGRSALGVGPVNGDACSQRLDRGSVVPVDCGMQRVFGLGLTLATGQPQHQHQPQHQPLYRSGQGCSHAESASDHAFIWARMAA